MRVWGVLAIGAILTLEAQPVAAQPAACATLTGARVISEDGKFLGTIESRYDSDSVFNKYGKGSRYDSDSIWNKYGDYGSEYASNSAMNPYSSSPPMLIKNRQVVGVLSKNKYVEGSIDPVLLGAVCFDFTPD
jgi:hypothetical protein